MRIIQVMPDFEMAGAQTMCENLVNELIKDKNNDVRIISFFNKKCEITERLEKKGVNIIYLSKKKGLDISIIFKIKKILDEFQPNIIHTHRYALEYIVPAVKISNIKQYKIIHTVHNIAQKEVGNTLQKLQKYLFKHKMVIPVAISEIVQDSIVKRYNLNKNNVPIIYNGIDLDSCIRKNNYSFNDRIVHIGRFTEQKNHEELIEIFNEILKFDKKLKLYLIGVGELQSNIRNKVKQLKIENSVVFLGEKKSCYKILNKADIFVLPSKWEGMPMSLIEAMATGLPCVAFPVGGIPNMICDGKNGYLPENALEFIQCICKIKADKELRKKIGKNAINDCYKFSSKLMAEEYSKLYKI